MIVRSASTRVFGVLMLCVVTFFATPAVLAETRIGEFRSKMDKWVEARQVASRERADWIGEKESLVATRKLLRQEKEALEAEIAELEQSDAGAEEERRELLLERAEYQRASTSLETRIRDLEEQVLALAPSLPDPLRKRLDLLLVQIPEDPEKTRVPLGQRLMNVLGVLAQAEKFNGTATFVGETRPIGGGDQKVQVRTLYWGLAQAIYIDAQGTTAGIGRPTPDGWKFVDDPELSADAKLLLDIYEGNVDTIAFVPVPAEIR